MDRCPFCNSEDIYFSKKKQIYVCEDCDATFSDNDVVDVQKQATEEKGLELFFSYGHDRNRSLVERIKGDLEKRGHHVWIDTSEIKAGDYWRNDILNGVMNSATVIAFLSEHSTRNPGVCLDELKIAVCVKGANVKTVLLEPESRIQQPATVSDIQWLDMSEWYEKKTANSDEFEIWYATKFQELCSVIESKDSIELNGDINTLKAKLTPYMNTEKEYNLLSKEFYGRKWLDEYIDNWRVNGKANALLVYGKPGSGKSAFSVNYTHFNSEVLGCFLCEWNREYTINPHKLIRTIAFRLATKLPDYRKMLVHQLADNPRLDDMDAELLFDFLLATPLSHLVDGNRNVGIILVDGLDEAATDGENPLAELFATCVRRLPKWLKFVFTSRPERNVSEHFEQFDSVDIVDDMPEGYNDIVAYLIKVLAQELKQSANRIDVINKISELSEGVFLYAELLVEDIKSGIIDLREVDSFPKGLGAFYRISMNRKFKTKEEFFEIRHFLEVLSVADTVPEKLLIEACGYSHYEYIKYSDILGSWVVHHNERNIDVVGFSHKSLKDWLGNPNQSGLYHVDAKEGALLLARLCRDMIKNKKIGNSELKAFVDEHIGEYYILSEEFGELQDFLLSTKETLYPYWKVWKDFPDSWDNEELLDAFWNSANRNSYLSTLQREGNTNYLSWLFEIIKEKYGIETFDRELVSVYMDIVHLSGDYQQAVEIATQYLSGYSENEIYNDEFLSMMRVRKIHHSMFYKPVKKLIDEAIGMTSSVKSTHTKVYNELLFLIGGNLGMLFGDLCLCKDWLAKSEAFALEHNLTDIHKRNARKLSDVYCSEGGYLRAEQTVLSIVSENLNIQGRYEAYLVGALGNIYTCENRCDEALKCYDRLLRYATANGLMGWIPHAYLGIANVNYRIRNYDEAAVFAHKALAIYKKIHQDWGIIMSEALLGACESKMGIAPIAVLCERSVKHAEKMEYGSCKKSIEQMCAGEKDFLELYFL